MTLIGMFHCKCGHEQDLLYSSGPTDRGLIDAVCDECGHRVVVKGRPAHIFCQRTDESQYWVRRSTKMLNGVEVIDRPGEEEDEGPMWIVKADGSIHHGQWVYSGHGEWDFRADDGECTHWEGVEWFCHLDDPPPFDLGRLLDHGTCHCPCHTPGGNGAHIMPCCTRKG